jgi:hypothetical protein
MPYRENVKSILHTTHPDKSGKMRYNTATCRSGGIGRRARLKIVYRLGVRVRFPLPAQKYATQRVAYFCVQPHRAPFSRIYYKRDAVYMVSYI